MNGSCAAELHIFARFNSQSLTVVLGSVDSFQYKRHSISIHEESSKFIRQTGLKGKMFTIWTPTVKGIGKFPNLQ